MNRPMFSNFSSIIRFLFYSVRFWFCVVLTGLIFYAGTQFDASYLYGSGDGQIEEDVKPAQSKSAVSESMGEKEDTENTAQIIKTNMFELEYKKLFELKTDKSGGGMGVSDQELILVTGDGQLRVMDLYSSQVIKPSIELPLNNESQARLAAGKIDQEERAQRAVDKVDRFMRYEDTMVVYSEGIKYLLVSYTHFDSQKSCFSLRVSSLRASVDRSFAEISAVSEDWDLLFSSEPCFSFQNLWFPFSGQMAGGRMDTFNALTGDILLSVGDYSFNGMWVPEYPQDQNVDYGKVLRINIHNKQKVILSIGHRNPQGIKIDDKGRIWSVEHGPQGGDELNLLQEGENYGWPKVTLGINYQQRPWPLNKDQGRHTGYRFPVFSWIPSIAPSNIDQSINFHPFWDGDLLIFSLKSKSIFRVRMKKERVMAIEQVQFFQRIRYGFNHAPTGKLYIWTDDGVVFEIKPGEDAWEFLEKSREQYKNKLPQKLSRSEKVLYECSECHSGTSSSVPNLAGILGRDIGATAYSDYSNSLREMDGMWDEENLKAYLKNPQVFAPGTSMPNPYISSEQALNEIVNALKEL